MTSRFLFSRPRRGAIALGLAIVALHYVTIDWLATHIGPARAETPPPPAAISAQLRLTLPEPAPAPVAPAPAKPVVAAKPKAAPKPAVAPQPATTDAAADTGSGPAGPAMPLEEPGAAAAPAAASAAAAPDPAAEPAAVKASAEAAPAGPEPAMPRRYNVNLPASADFLLDVKRRDADGTTWSGEAAMSWRNRAGQYKATLEVGLSMLVTRINLLVVSSEGVIDDAGIAPVTMTEKRKGRALTATHFNRETGRITFSASERSYPLPPGAQDKASLPFQLAGIGRSDVNQFAGDIDLFVGEDKEANLFHFVFIGEEEIDTRMGRLVTVHLSRPPKRGTYSSRLDIWLAPSQGWYPVQIRNTEASGALTTQTVSRITVTEPTGQ